MEESGDPATVQFHSPIATGKTFSTYLIGEKLGEGGMGAVYQAVHTRLKKTVAIKVLPPFVTQDAQTVSRFEREMEAVGRLDHPNIVRATDAGTIDGVHFLVMEYVEGKNLGQLVAEQGPQSVATCCAMIRQAALALEYAHQHGLLHRDIKPSNLMLTTSKSIKLLDLGLARLQDQAEPENQTTSLTLAGQVLGTPDYMAPEQWGDSTLIDHRADLYALGCTLFFLLVGRAPYGDSAHRTPASKMKGHVAEPIPDLKALRPDTPDAVVKFCERLMAKSPADRYQTAGELLTALTASQAGAEDSSMIGQKQHNIVAKKRWPLLAGLAVTFVMVVAAAVVSQLSLPQPKVEPTQPAIAKAKPAAELEKPEVTTIAPSPMSTMSSLPKPTPVEEPGKPPSLAIAPYEADDAKRYQEEWAKYSKVPIEHANSIGMKLILIPAGEFVMGSNAGKPDEQPTHPARITKPYYLGETEVTRGDWRQIMENEIWRSCESGGEGDEYPVDYVTWNEAAEFCQKLSKKEGKSYRLPTEAEWEHACRAGTTSEFSFGNDASLLIDFGWYATNTLNGDASTLQEVRKKKPNGFGLYDMHGSLWEWCADWHAVQYESSTLTTNPQGPATGTERSRRGGSFRNHHSACRSSMRFQFPPEKKVCGNGFRVILDLDQKSLDQK